MGASVSTDDLLCAPAHPEMQGGLSQKTDLWEEQASSCAAEESYLGQGVDLVTPRMTNGAHT